MMLSRICNLFVSLSRKNQVFKQSERERTSNIESSDVLKAIETAIPAKVIEQAIAKTQTLEDRKRSLPAQLVVSLVIAMNQTRCEMY